MSVARFTASLTHAVPFHLRKSPFAADVMVTSLRSFKFPPAKYPTNYESEFHAVDPSPILNWPVVRFMPSSPLARTGLAELQFAPESLLI